MSKKMWHKIFKSKSQKQQQQLNKINKRHSRGLYEEYQQLNELLNGEKSQVARVSSENENENGSSNSCSSSGNINVFEQQPQQSSFNSLALSEAQQQQQKQQQSQQLSTFSRVRNTFSLRRNSNSNNNSSSSSNNKKQTPNAKSTTMESDGDVDDEVVGPPPGPLTTGFSEIIAEQVVTSSSLSACPNCSRTFNTDALRKHIVVCEKMKAKKRKPFDSSRQRREGTSLSTYVLPKNFGLPNAEKAPGVHTPPSASRETSSVSSSAVPQENSPQSARRKAKDTTRGSLRKGGGATAAAAAAAAPAAPAHAEPPAAPAAPAAAPPSSSRPRATERSITRRIKDSATEHCPHCERSFNVKAFDRHVEWCKEKAIQANMKASNTAETSKAKERMEARKKYRPPNLKTKRSINRDKYSGAQEEQYEPEVEPPMTPSVQSVKSNSSLSIGGESFKSAHANTGSYKTPNSSGSYKTPPNGAFKTPLTSSDEKLERQLSNASATSSNSNYHGEKGQKSMDESSKREIFISIETEANAQGRSPISPDSLRHMVGNAQTPIDVLHIENGNEPEHAKFSKISDNEDQFDDETGRVHYQNRVSTAVTSPLPNVEANNAKNVIEKMRNDFKQLGEEASASVRRDILQRQEQVQQKQQDVKATTQSPSGDSDELSSLDGYPMSSSQSSRRGASSKLSTDSAYGSSNSPYCLSRQRSSELQSNNNTPRTPGQSRPHTASGAPAMSPKQSNSMMDASTQAQSNYGTLKARQRMFAPNGLGINTDAGNGNGNMEYSSSSSEQLMQQQEQHQQHHKQNSNYNYIQQQQSQPQVANNNNYELNALNLKNNNNNNSGGVGLTPTTSQHSLHSSNSNVSMKMSKFCHECGAKFVLEHAKFCMDCGVRRVVL
ncbi:homeobox protein 9 isoform X5 [Drosophila hydei]|uniref:Homeobox protein 9 isoform X5 n=1 Tax=Drosophila hydei TaxID=7224 RepID=A0A6J1LZ76_DROHY|nr:homeobox protein 9 isoform X5 [Drosophila hydei]